jgi:hypothetical protein
MARAEKRKYHYIYKITCKITNRFYIGMHSTDDLNDRYFGSGKRLWFSINYHGKENHIKEILEFLPSREALKEREKEIVNKELINEDLCMNLVVGGEGGYISEEGCKKGGVTSGNIQINKMLSDIVYKEKVLKTLRDTSINNHKTGKSKIPSRKGVKLTDEHKKKIGKNNSLKQKGVLNSQYGTCWITKDGLNKKIKKEDLENFLKDGWVKGCVKIY